MKKAEYYIKTNKGSFGPLHLNILKKLPLSKRTLVWKKGLEKWVSATTVHELDEMFYNSPPVLDSETDYLMYNLVYFIKLKIIGLRVLKMSLLLSISTALLSFLILTIIFKPNKFGQSDVNAINNYYQHERQIYINREREDRKKMARTLNTIHNNTDTLTSEGFWRLYLKVYENADQVTVNNGYDILGPAAMLPDEYVYGFWDYCNDANGQVFLNLTDIPKSFESRKVFLKEKAIRLSVFIFFACLILTSVILFVVFNGRTKLRKT